MGNNVGNAHYHSTGSRRTVHDSSVPISIPYNNYNDDNVITSSNVTDITRSNRLMRETKYVTRNVVSLPTLLTVLFVGLKLTGYIEWSWWWVLSPQWIPIAISLTAVLIYGIIILVKEIIR